MRFGDERVPAAVLCEHRQVFVSVRDRRITVEAAEEDARPRFCPALDNGKCEIRVRMSERSIGVDVGGPEGIGVDVGGPERAGAVHPHEVWNESSRPGLLARSGREHSVHVATLVHARIELRDDRHDGRDRMERVL
jgi:hypothetical protein